MDKALYIAMTGAKHNLLAQGIHANNLANVNTTGFRSDLANAVTAGVYYGDGHPTRAYSVNAGESTNFEHGSLIQTDNDLDVAIRGDGFIAVQAADGVEAYTRAGAFVIDSEGMLRTVQGNFPVLGGGGPVLVPPQQKIQIGADGTITVRGAGQGASVLATIDRLKLVNPELSNLQKRPDGLLVRVDGEIEEAAVEVTVVAGYTESSNVNPVTAMVEMLAISKQFQLQLKMMSDLESNAEAASKLMRIG